MWRAAWSPVMRGIATSRIAMSGRRARTCSTAPTPSSASATTLMPSWRSRSIRRPARTIPWSSAIRMWSTRASLRDVEPDTGAAPRRGGDGQLATDQPRAFGHPAQADAAAVAVDRVRRVESMAVVADAQLDAVRREDAQLEIDIGRARVLRRVRERLLDDPVDDRLLVLGDRLRCALPVQQRLDAGLLAEARELALDRGDQAEVIERRRPQLAGQAQELLHRLVDERLELCHLARQRLRHVLADRLQSQQDRGQRLVDLVVEVAREPPAVLLLRAQHEPTRPAPLVLDPAQEAPERDRKPLDLLDRGARHDELGGRLRRVELLQTCDQLLERREAAPQ